jgi:hypothetical protein
MNQNNNQNNQNANKEKGTKQNTNKQTENNYESQTRTNVMNLEKLKIEYKIQLTAYKQAVSNYVNFLQNSSNKPCSSFSPDSTGISQPCYDAIWKNSGCTTTPPNADESWAKSQTLDALIYDSFLWATMTDSTHREGCYGKNSDSNNTKYNTSTSADYDINKKSYTQIKGRAFWGTGKATSENVSSVGTIEQCKALCAKTSNCTGATFNATANSQPMCWLRTGDGELMQAQDSDYAIIPEAKKYLSIIESINKKLLETNQQIQKLIKQSKPLYNTIQAKGQQQNDELIKNYAQLSIERKKIKNMLEKYQDLDNSEIEGNIKINQNYYTFILLLIISVCICILFYKFSGMFTIQQNSSSSYIQQGGELSQNTYIFVLIIIIGIILVNYFTNIKNTTTNIGNGISNMFSSFFGLFGNFFTPID